MRLIFWGFFFFVLQKSYVEQFLPACGQAVDATEKEAKKDKTDRRACVSESCGGDLLSVLSKTTDQK